MRNVFNIMTAVILAAGCTTTSANKRSVAQEAVPGCFNAASGKQMTPEECGARVCHKVNPDTGQMYASLQYMTNGSLGPCYDAPAPNSNERDCEFNRALVKNRISAVQAFSSEQCSDAKVEYRQCIDGNLTGSFPYAECH